MKVFSISNKKSLIEAEKFLETLKDHGRYQQVPVIAVGNKSDMEYSRLLHFEIINIYSILSI